MDVPYSLNIKIQGGTTRSGNLCRSCKYAMLARGVNNQEMKQCTRFEKTPRWDVSECNEYMERNQPYLHEMEEIAWRVVTKGSRALGFVNPTEFKKREREER